MQLHGSNLIAGEARSAGAATYRSVAPETGEAFGPDFHDATPDEVEAAAVAAAESFPALRRAEPALLAALLRDVAERLEGLGDVLVELAARETGLGTTRITGERGRTCAQLRAFADLVEAGDHLDIRIDTPDASATPPRPDLRRMQIPIGPVAVFGASNFPLAFSVPGGDTAAALAAGCPVVAKAHPSHPGTSELCGRAIADAVRHVGLPAGTFSLLHGRDVAVSRALVLAPQIKAVGFTGSEAAGRALFDLGAGREEPIPVYAEMGSLNPLFITPRALEERSGAIAEGLVGSMTMGTGQFCTKPGLVFLPDSPEGRVFEDEIAAAAGEVEAGPLLNEGIAAGLRDRLSTSTALDGVAALVDGGAGDGPGFRASPTVLVTSREVFDATPELLEEHFGPVTVLVRCGSVEEMRTAVAALPGALTAGVHGTAADAEADDVATLHAALRELAGRVLWNQFPTGVAVAPAMHHGGPYPATTFAAHTSVGTAAIRRFLRPVTYQATPQALLPAPLRDANPMGLLRMVDGTMTAAAVS